MIRHKNKLILSLALALSVSPLTSAFAQGETTPVVKNETTAQRIQHLVDSTIDLFRNSSQKDKFALMEKNLKEASSLDPFNMELKFYLASTLVFQKKVEEAVGIYKQIVNFQPNHFEANLLYGVYSKVNGDEATYQKSMAALQKIDPQRAAAFQAKLQAADGYLITELNTTVPQNLPQKNHAIIILGFALEDNGSMKQPLIERLQAGLAIAKKYPHSKIIVTGGSPKNGITEAEAMSKWLLEKGVDQNRIVLEKSASDTVENALCTTAILETMEITDATLVTNATHMRRALSGFQASSDHYARLMGKENKRTFTNMVYMDYASAEKAKQVTKDEKLGIYRDLLRTSGIWAFPGYQR
ncbi:YdcF family protein [Brevibacillus laterosporus]|uniref:ElyC/SanA/YdcF family protein n=1 Tax=Brevibacillus laterosporus TaxID=1465 RepID=UPI002405AABC|nr:ElyC/SanA/YdcF family protein [Brevibacillus laterosporus]MDF9412641.1 YdcF family protein [Brevibacillus laterosporus]